MFQCPIRHSSYAHWTWDECLILYRWGLWSSTTVVLTTISTNDYLKGEPMISYHRFTNFWSRQYQDEHRTMYDMIRVVA
jgi:Txe/YoeB family toxin of Txe-Axe toxin-antitoxin module